MSQVFDSGTTDVFTNFAEIIGRFNVSMHDMTRSMHDMARGLRSATFESHRLLDRLLQDELAGEWPAERARRMYERRPFPWKLGVPVGGHSVTFQVRKQFRGQVVERRRHIRRRRVQQMRNSRTKCAGTPKT